MSIMRVNKTKNYTVMSNYHLKEREMSLKAKGLLSLMLSLPDDWDYSISGLVAICKENETSVKSALSELKQFGYLEVKKLMPKKDQRSRIEYIYDIFEHPNKRENEDPQEIKKQDIENLPLESLPVENQGQLNTKELSINNNTDIHTDNAREDKSAFYFLRKQLGLEDRMPSKNEIDFSNKWLDKWDVPIALIDLAKNKCIDQIQAVKFQYMDKIISEYYKNGVRTIEQANRFHDEYKKRKIKEKETIKEENIKKQNTSYSKQYSKPGKDRTLDRDNISYDIQSYESWTDDEDYLDDAKMY